jgi:uncharacterized protein (TIGR03083 family)
MNDPWAAIHAERHALLDDLQRLDDSQWDAASSCGQWKVRDVVGHIIATAKVTPAGFLTGMAASGFRFHVMNEKRATAEAGGTPKEILERLRSVLDAKTKPPGPIDAMVGEAIVHGEDIRRPLGLKHAYDAGALVASADFYRKGNLLIGGKRRAEGLTLRATDHDWQAGDGPEVHGPMAALVSAIAGRADALGELDGPGLATLRSRMP